MIYHIAKRIYTGHVMDCQFRVYLCTNNIHKITIFVDLYNMISIVSSAFSSPKIGCKFTLML